MLCQKFTFFSFWSLRKNRRTDFRVGRWTLIQIREDIKTRGKAEKTKREEINGNRNWKTHKIDKNGHNKTKIGMEQNKKIGKIMGRGEERKEGKQEKEKEGGKRRRMEWEEEKGGEKEVRKERVRKIEKKKEGNGKIEETKFRHQM